MSCFGLIQITIGCPLVATAPTNLMPHLLDTKNQSNMRIPLECHLTLYGTKSCIVNPLPLEDFPIDGPSNHKAQEMMHGDVGTGVDGLKEFNHGPYNHNGIHIDDTMEHGSSPIHYELVSLLPVASNNIISAFQQGHKAFPLFKVKTTDGNAYGHTYLFCKSFGGRTI
jgi:hypothetical protein